MFRAQNYNPDVLSCLANLSSDEVFTPPKLANEILDMLPQELFNSKNITFLDPVSKSGIFLREIAKRLIKGLEKEIPNLQERVNHICSKQLFGIGITELTAFLSRRSVYCSKKADGKYSICDSFNSAQGNIIFNRIEHKWIDEKCLFCGANQSNYKRGDDLETHAYQFIHTNKPQEIFNMKFDVIIGNPPYQLEDGGHGKSAAPIYHKFIQQAKKMKPRYLSMIIPARWYAGGKGLDEFRSEMLNDKHIRKIVDFENSQEVFPGVDVAGGICYFLWDRDNAGKCEFVNHYKGISVKSIRNLDEFPILIRHGKAVPIIKKILEFENNNGNKNVLSERISSRKPFGLPTNYIPKSSGIPCWFTQRIGLKYADLHDIKDNLICIGKWKLLIPKSPIAGQTDFSKPVGFYYEGNIRIAKPGECCTESWLVASAFLTEEELISFKSYLFTKIVRFLLLQTVVSQDVTKQNFIFIPDLDNYTETYTDDILRKRWRITEDEWNFIDSKIK